MPLTPRVWDGIQVASFRNRDLNPNMIALMKLLRPNADPNQNWGLPILFRRKSSIKTTLSGPRGWTTTSAIALSCSCATTTSGRRSCFRSAFGAQRFAGSLPSDIKGKNRSDSVSASLTHVFSPTMTNETVFAYTLSASRTSSAVPRR